ncbi:unnamed protein product [Lymnaea stagnalis]|uniref:Uncharacterized protein n=1 Tax=Lymnaea stagnalis TaxID=6523 RepID=A0AAV2H5T8_LYMST
MKLQTFITNLQNEIQKTYSSAVVKLWCIEELEGTAQNPGTRRKRQSIKPVKVSVYVLRDSSTDSLSNITRQKDFISQPNLLSVLAQSDGAPNNIIKAGEFAYFNMQEVTSLSKASTTNSSVSWWDTVYGPIVTAILLAFGVVLLCLIIFCCCRHHRRKRYSESHSSEEVFTPPVDYRTSRQFKGYQVGWLHPSFQWPTPVHVRHAKA